MVENTIRYRVYDKEVGAYVGTSRATGLVDKLIWEIMLTTDSQIIELSTGMQDGFKQEIFVGDIITVDYVEFFEVVYDADEGMYRASGEGVSVNFYDIPPYAYHIVGNIHDDKQMVGG